MLIATVLMIVGLLGGIIGAQLRGLRLGGVLIVPLFAIYMLRSFGTFPVLVMSVIGGYVSIWIIKRRLLIFGRTLFVLAILTSGLVPLVIYLFTTLGYGPQSVINELGFIGSVLPGIAVYNFHRMSEEDRVLDAVWSMATLLFLVVAGIGLVIFVGLSPLATVTPPVLLGPDSDIARAFELIVEGAAHPVILPFPKELALLGLGLFLSEAIRARWGLRVGGLIVLPLLVLFAFRNQWLLLVYFAAALGAYVGIQMIHWWTLIYGRVLLSMGVIIGLLTAVSVAPSLSFSSGLLPFFAGVLGGVGAYNFHVTARAELRTSIIVAAGNFVVLTTVARLFLTPLSEGILVQVRSVHLVGGGIILALTAWELYRLEASLPSKLESSPPPEPTTTDGTVWDSGDVESERML